MVFDVEFILFLRHQEKDIGVSFDDNEWGYGQILVLFVWVPVFVEYIYLMAIRKELVDTVEDDLNKLLIPRQHGIDGPRNGSINVESQLRGPE